MARGSHFQNGCLRAYSLLRVLRHHLDVGCLLRGRELRVARLDHVAAVRVGHVGLEDHRLADRRVAALLGDHRGRTHPHMVVRRGVAWGPALRRRPLRSLRLNLRGGVPVQLGVHVAVVVHHVGALVGPGDDWTAPTVSARLGVRLLVLQSLTSPHTH